MIARAMRLGLLALAAAAACSPEIGPYRAVVETDDRNLGGEELYLRDCAWCHGNEGEGTARGPDLRTGQNGPAFTDFMLTTGRMPIGRPDELIQRREPVYDAEEIRALVDYVAFLGGVGPPVPTPQTEGADIGLGLELYQENCSACHSPTMIGGALTAQPETEGRSPVAPELLDATPRQIAEAMLVGPGAMPVFGSNTFEQEEIDAIVAYVVHQQNPADRGGAPIGRVGPVSEGAVGWLIGLGAMLLIARIIGTSSSW
jgi:ubiquinol-cytochrome c reductase cytochrome c subunit